MEDQKILLQKIVEGIQEKKGKKIITADLSAIDSASAEYFIICEGASIVENIAKINNNIPEGLVDVLKSLQKSAGTGVVQWVQKTVDKILGGRNE